MIYVRSSAVSRWPTLASEQQAVFPKASQSVLIFARRQLERQISRAAGEGHKIGGGPLWLELAADRPWSCSPAAQLAPIRPACPMPLRVRLMDRDCVYLCVCLCLCLGQTTIGAKGAGGV